MSYSSQYGNDPYQSSSGGYQRRRRRNFSGLKLRLIIAGAIVLFSVVSFLAKGQINPITGKNQRVNMSVDDEIMMGLQAAPQMGQPSRSQQGQMHVDRIGARLVNVLETEMLKNNGVTNPYPFEFHLLADDQINAFALPGGQVFVTEGLYQKLTSDGQIAGVIGHEIGHVLERHGAERMAKQSLTQGVVGAVGVAGGDMGTHRAAQMVGTIVNNKYGRRDERESDEWGIALMMRAGYSPEHLMTVMDVLEKSAGPGGPPEFMSTHPKPANRRKYIEDIIAQQFPNGLPPGLQ